MLYEYNLLKQQMQNIAEFSEEYPVFVELYNINLKMWEYQDWQREKWESVKDEEIDEELFWGNKQEHLLNDERAAIKKKINLKYNSKIVEEKQFLSYGI